MKIQALFVVALAILLATRVSLSQQTVQPTQSSKVGSSEPGQDELRTIVVSVKYYPVDELGSLLRAISDEEVVAMSVQHSNRLILTGSQKRIDQMLHLIQELDVPREEAQQSQYLTCRVYMLELPSKDQNLKPFSLVLERPSQWQTEWLLDAAKDANVQISTLLQRTQDDKWELVIEGRAASSDALKPVLTKITDSQVRQLRWDDEAFTATVPAAQVSQLPSQLQDHLRKFLGDQVRTVGYWFGNLSVPGNFNAPIGPWRLDMKTQSEQGTDLVLEVRVTRESPIPFVNETQLLSNTIQGKAGKPILVGYNRESYGTRVMGAMVILLEPDTTALTTEAKTQ